MKKCIFVCVFFFSFIVTTAQQPFSDAGQVSYESSLPQRIFLRDNLLSTRLQSSFQAQTIESSRDSLFAKQTFGRKAWRAAKIIFIGE